MAESKKRIPKNDLKLNISLNEEQKKTVSDFYENDVNIITGDFGVGKSALACYIALQCLQKKKFDQIIFTRPVLKSRMGVLGYTPGSLSEKLEPFTSHLKHLLVKLYKKELIEKYIDRGQIVFEALELSKGKNYDNSLVIVDEFTDLDYQEFRNILSRIGKNSKIIFSGSEEQIDYSMKSKSCLNILNQVKSNLPNLVVWNNLTINHRNDTMFQFIKQLDNIKNV